MAPNPVPEPAERERLLQEFDGSLCPACHDRAHDPGGCAECPRCELHTDEAMAFVLRHEPELVEGVNLSTNDGEEILPLIATALEWAEADGEALRNTAKRTAISGEDWRYTNGFDRALRYFQTPAILAAVGRIRARRLSWREASRSIIAEAEAAGVTPDGESLHRPGDSHEYHLECAVCGQRGQVNLSIEPQVVEPPFGEQACVECGHPNDWHQTDKGCVKGDCSVRYSVLIPPPITSRPGNE